MIDPRLEEQAALAALGWSDDPTGLDQAAAHDAEVANARREFAETAATLALALPPQAPPVELRARILAALPPVHVEARRPVARPVEAPQSLWSRRLAWPQWPQAPYAIAALLMSLVLLQFGMIRQLDRKLDFMNAGHRDPFGSADLVALAPQGDHGKARIMVAWDGKMSAGMIAMDEMPEAPPGHDYQLWILDPSQSRPVSAGIIPHGVTRRHFAARGLTMPGRPGFAVSLENAGGSPLPSKEILFAVAPSP